MTDYIISAAANAVVVAAGSQGPQGIQGLQGVQGQQGTPASGGAAHTAFAWGDANPLTLVTTTDAAVIAKVEVLLLTAFDAAATLSIGTAADHSLYMGVTDNDTASAGEYQTNPCLEAAGGTAICLYKTLIGNVSAGNGIILIYYQE